MSYAKERRTMEKIKLSNSQEFDLIPMGIVTQGNNRFFKIISDLPYVDILSIFSDESSLASIDYIGEDGSVARTYQDCVKMLALSYVPDYKVDDTTVADIYIVTVTTDATARELQRLNGEVDNVVLSMIMMSMPMM